MKHDVIEYEKQIGMYIQKRYFCTSHQFKCNAVIQESKYKETKYSLYKMYRPYIFEIDRHKMFFYFDKKCTLKGKYKRRERKGYVEFYTALF